MLSALPQNHRAPRIIFTCLVALVVLVSVAFHTRQLNDLNENFSGYVIGFLVILGPILFLLFLAFCLRAAKNRLNRDRYIALVLWLLFAAWLSNGVVAFTNFITWEMSDPGEGPEIQPTIWDFVQVYAMASLAIAAPFAPAWFYWSRKLNGRS